MELNAELERALSKLKKFENPGIELIAKEREEQIKKHGISVDIDVRFNGNYQLGYAASFLSAESWGHDDEEEIATCHCPDGWDEKSFLRMLKKPYKDRLIIAGALIVAEVERLIRLEEGLRQAQTDSK